jgi:Fe-S-cluster-containing hydrogenase component 2
MYLRITPSRCTGCLACQVYCSLQHEGQVNLDLARITVWRSPAGDDYLPLVCVPCEAKDCLAACPEPGAIRAGEDGIVRIDEALCTGCSKCVRACPIGAIRFHRLPGRGKHGKAVAIKCDLCDGDPWCEQVCPAQAIELVKEAGAQAALEQALLQRQEWLTGGLILSQPGRSK